MTSNSSKRIKYFRLKNIYKPNIIGYLKENPFYKNWRKEKPKKEEIKTFIDYLNTLTEEIE